MTSTDEVAANFENIKKMIKDIKSLKPETRVAFFPENSLYMRVKEGESVAGLEPVDAVFADLRKLAMENNLALHLGSVPLRHLGQLTNSSVFIDRDGNMQTTYSKIHLFDIELEGQKPIRESDVFKHGERPSVLHFANWSFGQTICYDLRFSELFSAYAKQSVDAVLVPAAFVQKTGEAHWHVLLRARAIESQCYVIAAAQAGEHRSQRTGTTRKTYGHSLVVSPWGEILAEGSADHPEILLVALDKGTIAKVRRQIPMQGHRRI